MEEEYLFNLKSNKILIDTIFFHIEDLEEFSIDKEDLRKEWLADLAKAENYSINNLNYIFCSDEYLHKINVDYLDHDTLTDIITFDNSDEKQIIEGDIFISVDRVSENANQFNVSFFSELNRVLAHGLLHLIGYKDKTDSDKKLMREKENYYINLCK